ncbi:hypothetical protein ABEG18_11340 [Alsobacter sp. KACC 23698]|uniref:Uncharacterized protein n=1 Tax=Alsobacter sp. KACC 23698 TaxID=3149229 RepID=A0AAU7JLQ2_9HYPH
MTTLALHDRAASPRSGVTRRLWAALVQRRARRPAKAMPHDGADPLPGLTLATGGLLETALLLRN